MELSNPIAERYQDLTRRLSDVCRDAGRDCNQVRIMAVTKTRPWDDVAAACRCGLALLGENRAQEMLARFPDPWPFPAVEPWFIGHLQGNKVSKVVPRVAGVMSIDSPALLASVARTALTQGIVCRIMIEMNTSGEASKHGLADDDAVLALAGQCRGLEGVRLEGLMTIGPLDGGLAAAGRAFALLRATLERLHREGHDTCRELSMGMSGDWPVAVAEGATIIRIGTALFGEREAP